MSAGPGTGKTQVCALRLAHLVSDGVRPGQILVLSFSRSAVATLTRRLAQPGVLEQRLLEDLRHLAVRTFDSWTFRMLRQGGATAAELLSRTHDANIEDLSERIEADKDLELLHRLSGLRHVVVDEFQDLNGPRLRLVRVLLRHLVRNPEVGFTVLGDPVQAIYRFADRLAGDALPIDPWSAMRSEFSPRLQEIELLRNFRATEKLAAMSRRLRTILQSELVDAAAKRTAMLKFLSRIPVTGDEDRLSSAWLDAMSGGSIAILTRGNGEAMQVARALFGQEEQAPALPVHLRLSGATISAPAWVAALLARFTPRRLTRSVFPAIHAKAMEALPPETLEALAFPGPADAWRRLAHASAESDDATAIDLDALVERLQWTDAFPEEAGAMAPGVHVSTIHQSKGMEFDQVALLEWREHSSSLPEDPLEEAHIGFVAVSRAGRTLSRIPQDAIQRPPTEREFAGRRRRLVGWGKMHSIQVGLAGDLDAQSFVDADALGTDAAGVAEHQQQLLERLQELRGRKVLLRPVERKCRFRDWIYEVCLQQDGVAGAVLARMAPAFTMDLLDMLWSAGFALPHQLYNARIGEPVSLGWHGDLAPGIPEPWRSSRLWLGFTLVGTADFKTWKRNGD